MTPWLSLPRRIVPLVPLVLLALAVLSLGASEARAASPRIAWEGKVFDFGDTIQGRTIRHAYKFRNVGDAPLQITKVDPSCGCTLVAAPAEAIAPGAAGEIAVEFDSGTRVGFQNFRIVVFSNDPAEVDLGPKITLLQFRGEVLTRYVLSPPMFNLGRLTVGDGAPARTLTVKAAKAREAGFRIKAIDGLPSWMTLKPTALEGGGYTLELVVAASAPIGRIDRHVMVKTDLKSQPTLAVRVLAEVAGPFNLPPSVLLDGVTRGTTRKIIIERVDGRDGLKILGIKRDRSRLGLRLRVLQTGRIVELEVTVLPTAPLGPFSGVLDLRFDDPKQPRGVIPIFGVIDGDLAAGPLAVAVKEAVKAGARLARIEITSRRAERLESLRLEIKGAPAKAHVETVEGRAFVVVEASRDATATEFAGGALVVHSELAPAESLSLPFLAPKPAK